MKRMLVLIGLLALLAACSSGPGGVEEKLAEIERSVTAIEAMTPAQKNSITRLAAEARELIAAGKQKAAGAKLDEALTIVQKARDADAFNKAE